MMETLKISCAHDIAYISQYVGIALGEFAKHGIGLQFYQGRGSVDDTVGAVNRGEVDLLLGSCVYGVRLAQTGVAPVVVAQSNQQTRHVIAQRADGSDDLQWPDLRGKVIVVYPGEAPTAWAAFTYALRKAGLSLGEVKLIFGYTAQDAIAEFVRGVGDVLFVDGEAALRDDLRTVLPVCRQAGRLPWSVYMTDRALLAKKRPLFEGFAAALGGAQTWLRVQSAETIARTVASCFPSYTHERLVAVVEFYRSLDLWAATSAVQLDQLERWSQALQLGGLIAPGMQLTDYLDVL